jgi:carbon storage regulator CsrA
MLVLSRKTGERLLVGNATIVIKAINGNRVQIAIEAPPEIRILRGEVKPNREAPVKPC